MDNNYIIITIDGRDYYIQADKIFDLAFIDNKLVNISNSSITLVTSFDTVTTYPRITCNAMQQCTIRSSSTGSQYPVTSNYQLKDKFNINMLQSKHFYSLFLLLLFILVSFKLLHKK